MATMKKLKITLAILMTLALLIVGSPFTAMAETGDMVCTVGGSTYSSINDAVAAANDGAVITVFADTTISSKMTITKKIELTSANGSEITVTAGETFTIGSGDKLSDTPGEVTISGDLKITTSKSALFYIKSGTFTMKDNVYVKATHQYPIDSEAAGEAPVYINIYGGTMESTATAKDKGTIYFGGTNSVITMTGGTLIQNRNDSYAVKMRAANGQINVSGGHIKAVNNTLGIYDPLANKQINISGGIVEATDSTAIYMYSKCDYLTVNISDNALVKAAKNTLKITSPMSTVNVTGGTVLATDDAPVMMYYGTLNVTGGTFILEGNNASADMIRSQYDDTMLMSGVVSINGGLFVNKNTANDVVMNDSAPDTNPISFNAGKVLYKSNVLDVVDGKTEAPKNIEVTYDGETYYAYCRFAGAAKKYAGVMDSKVTLRLVEGSSGVRFVADFSKKVVDDLSTKGAVTYGVIIVPTAYLVELDGFTVEALTAKYGANGFLNIACTEGNGFVAYSDGSASVQAAIVNIKAANYAMEFSAVAYACVNGEYFYTAYDQNVNSATAKELATEALADTAAQYTPAQQTILNAYAA